MNNIIKLMAFIVLVVFITGCTTSNVEENYTGTESNLVEEKPTILTTFYPVEEITKAIVLDTSNVEVLVGAGVEPHSYEPTPSQILSFSKADVFVTMGGMFEHLEKEIVDTNSNIFIIESSHDVKLIKGEEHDDHHDEHHEEEGHEEDHMRKNTRMNITKMSIMRKNMMSMKDMKMNITRKKDMKMITTTITMENTTHIFGF